MNRGWTFKQRVAGSSPVRRGSPIFSSSYPQPARIPWSIEIMAFGPSLLVDPDLRRMGKVLAVNIAALTAAGPDVSPEATFSRCPATAEPARSFVFNEPAASRPVSQGHARPPQEIPLA